MNDKVVYTITGRNRVISRIWKGLLQVIKKKTNLTENWAEDINRKSLVEIRMADEQNIFVL